MKIIGVSGHAQAGKDSFAAAAILAFPGRVMRRAFADGVREEALAAGKWDGRVPYSPQGRSQLQAYGMARRQGNPNYWIDRALWAIKTEGNRNPDLLVAIIPDVRFVNEADEIKRVGGTLARVNRL